MSIICACFATRDVYAKTLGSTTLKKEKKNQCKLHIGQKNWKKGVRWNFNEDFVWEKIFVW